MTVPVLSWLHVPGSDFAAALAADVDLSVSALVGARGDRRGRAPARPDRPDPPQGRHRPGPQRRVRRRLARPGRRGPPAGGRGRGRGRRRLVPLRLRRRARPPHGAAPAGALRRGRRAGRARRLRPGGAAPGQLGRHADRPGARFDLVRPGLAVYGLSPVPDLGDPAAFGLTPAMTFAADWRVTRPCRPGRASATATQYVTDRDTTLALVPVGYADGIPRNADQRRPGPASAACATPSPAGSAWTSSSSTSGPSSRCDAGRARSCCSAGAGPASRPPQDWAGRPARSPTRSSPGSVPACPASTSEDDAVSSSRRRTLTGLGVGLAAAGAAAAAGSGRRAARCAPAAPPRPWSRHRPPTTCVPDEELRRHRRRRHAAARRDRRACPGAATAVGRRRPDASVLSHGYALSLRCWLLPAAGAAAAGYRLVLWDQRGHGRSGLGSQESPPSTSSAVTWPASSTQAAPEGPLVLVGHSMGGMTMMSLAGRPARALPRAGRRRRVHLHQRRRPGRGLVGPAATCSARSCTGSLRSPSASWPAGQSWSTRCSAAGQRPRGAPGQPLLVRLAGAARSSGSTADMIVGTRIEVIADFLPTFDSHDEREALAAFVGIEVLVLGGTQDLLTPPEHSEEIVPAAARRRARRGQGRRPPHHARAPRGGQRAAARADRAGAAGPLRRAARAGGAAGAPHRDRPHQAAPGGRAARPGGRRHAS